jgi:hypothetical protein
MGKTITCPVKKWPGTIVIAHPMTLPQVALFQRIMFDVQGMDKETLIMEWCADVWPAMRQLIEEWNIKKPPFPDEDKFPGHPINAVDEFFIWLYKELLQAFNEAESEEIPKD